MVRQFFLLLLLALAPLARAQTPAQANKRLFDKTVDELNFRTMETVYDKSFTRGKFPVALRTAAARRDFDGFGGNAALKQLFLNYNGVAERYKGRYGNGPATLAEFQKQLNSVLLDKNFEFFIHNLPRDERVALVRAEQRLIQQATAQFNASGAAPDDVPGAPAAEAESQAEAPVAAPLTTHDEAPAAAPAAALSDEPAAASASGAGFGSAPHRDWFAYLMFALVLASFLLLLYIAAVLLPTISRRINHLSADPEPEAAPRSLASRLRPGRSPGLREDRYEDDEDDHEPADRARHDDD